MRLLLLKRHAPIPTWIASASPLHRRGPTLQKLNHEDDHRDDQQEMDETPQGIGGNQAQEPQHQQDHKDRPQHVRLLSSLCAGWVTYTCLPLSGLQREGREAELPVQGFSRLAPCPLYAPWGA